MIEPRSGEPITALRPFIQRTKDLGLPVFQAWLRENKNFYADAPQYGVPVVLLDTSNDAQRSVVGEIEEFASEFLTKLATLTP